MTLIYIFLLALAILLCVNIILTLKAGKKESGNELIEIIPNLFGTIGTLTSNLKDEFVTNRKESAETASSHPRPFYQLG